MRVVFDRDDDNNWKRTDAGRIVQTLHSHGVECSETDAITAWQAFSDSMAASWMHIPDDDIELICCVMPYLRAEV